MTTFDSLTCANFPAECSPARGRTPKSSAAWLTLGALVGTILPMAMALAPRDGQPAIVLHPFDSRDVVQRAVIAAGGRLLGASGSHATFFVLEGRSWPQRQFLGNLWLVLDASGFGGCQPAAATDSTRASPASKIAQALK